MPEPHSYDAALTSFPRWESDSPHFTTLMKQLGGAPSSHTLAHWFNALGRLQQLPADSTEFNQAAVEAMLEPGGLDCGLLLVREGEQWQALATTSAAHETTWLDRPVHLELLERTAQERRTLFHDARCVPQVVVPKPAAHGNTFVVTAPLLDAAGEVTGALVGMRIDHMGNKRRGIRPLEAQFVQAVADAVAAGQMRRSREMELVRLRSRLELAFSPTVARELESNPQLLEGSQREVSILFCDLRGFTSLSQQLAPRQSYALLGDVMDRFTHDVMRHEGVLLDYFGDGLAAFWNAPLDQPHHAHWACRAAQAMLASLAEVSDDWLPITDLPLRAGIGIHTGNALVGNAGSRSRIKYGPRGNVVNLASRVQGATKTFGCNVLITSSTAEHLSSEFVTRSLGTIPLAGFSEPVALHELVTITGVETRPGSAESQRSEVAFCGE